MEMSIKVTTTLVLNPDELRIVGLALLHNSLKGAEKAAALSLNTTIQTRQCALYEKRSEQLHKQVELAEQAFRYGGIPGEPADVPLTTDHPVSE